MRGAVRAFFCEVKEVLSQDQISNYEYIAFYNLDTESGLYNASKEITQAGWNSGPQEFLDFLRGGKSENTPEKQLEESLKEKIIESYESEKIFYQKIGLPDNPYDFENKKTNYPNRFEDMIIQKLYGINGGLELFQAMHSVQFRDDLLSGYVSSIESTLATRVTLLIKKQSIKNFNAKTNYYRNLDDKEIEDALSPLLAAAQNSDNETVKKAYLDLIKLIKDNVNASLHTGNIILNLDTLEKLVNSEELYEGLTEDAQDQLKKNIEKHLYEEHTGFLKSGHEKTLQLSASKFGQFASTTTTLNGEGIGILELLQDKGMLQQAFVGSVVKYTQERKQLIEEAINNLIKVMEENGALSKKEGNSQIQYKFTIVDNVGDLIESPESLEKFFNSVRMALQNTSDSAQEAFDLIINKGNFKEKYFREVQHLIEKTKKSQESINSILGEYGVRPRQEISDLLKDKGERQQIVDYLNTRIKKLIEDKNGAKLQKGDKKNTYVSTEVNENGDSYLVITVPDMKKDKEFEANVEKTLDDLDSIVRSSMGGSKTGYLSNKIGAFAELFFAILISSFFHGDTEILGPTLNEMGEEAHADIRALSEQIVKNSEGTEFTQIRQIGFQLKEYLGQKSPNFNLYKENKAIFPVKKNSNDVLVNRYIPKKYIASFNFILVNDLIKDPFQGGNNAGNTFIGDDETQKYFSNMIIFPLMRFNDYSWLDEQSMNVLINNFYVINGYLIPTSLVLFTIFSNNGTSTKLGRITPSVATVPLKEKRPTEEEIAQAGESNIDLFKKYYDETKVVYTYESKNSFTINLTEMLSILNKG